MKIQFKNKKLEKICTNAGLSMRKFGKRNAELIAQRLMEISIAPTIKWLVEKGLGRCHALTGNRKGQYAVDLEHPKRMIFTVELNIVEISIILEIVDYH